MNTIELSEDAFSALFTPIRNHLDPNAGFDWGDGYGTLFETFGEDLAFVQSQPVDRVWTIIEGDDGMEIANGFHLVNRFGYIVTEVPCACGLDVTVPIELNERPEITFVVSVAGGLVQDIACNSKADAIIIDWDTNDVDHQSCFEVPIENGRSDTACIHRIPVTSVEHLETTDVGSALRVFLKQEVDSEA